MTPEFMPEKPRRPVKWYPNLPAWQLFTGAVAAVVSGTLFIAIDGPPILIGAMFFFAVVLTAYGIGRVRGG